MKTSSVTTLTNMANKVYQTNFKVAVEWLNNDMVLCNKLPEIDPSVWDNMMPVIDITKSSDTPDECPHCGSVKVYPYIDEDGDETDEWKCEFCGHVWNPDDEKDDDGYYAEIFQWLITDCSESDVQYLRETFGLLFTYSDLLDCYILCVTHWGTGWDYVDWTTTNPNAERKLGERK